MLASGLVADATAEQASQPAFPAAGGVDAGGFHSCAVVSGGSLRCWGFNADGQLGYANAFTVGDDETPASVGPVSLGGHGVRTVAAGDSHTCAVLDDASVRCWGFGAQGRLGYDSQNNVTDPASVGPVYLGRDGTGRTLTAVAITAGAAHTCALLDDGSVRCWGFGGTGLDGVASADGRLGYGNNNNIGDDETPGSVGPVNLGGPATTISAGGDHTCALLTDGSVRCWGVGRYGQLGYGDTSSVGATPDTTPDKFGPVKLGGPAVAISAGAAHSCALLANGSVRCWGSSSAGQLGYGNRNDVGDTPASTPDTVGPVNLGGQKAVAISAGYLHTCAVLEGGSVRCWGLGTDGRLGYGNQANIGDNETPNSVGRVDLGSGRTATAISAGRTHTCARLDDGHMRCWGPGANGRLGYCNQNSIGDDETPGSAGPVNLLAGDGGAACPAGPANSGPAAPAPVPVAGPAADPDAARGRRLANCLADVRRAERRQTDLLGGSMRHRARARHGIRRRAARARMRCLARYGRIPGPITGLRALSFGDTHIVLEFNAPGTNGTHPPPARSYVVAQSRRPIRSALDFARAHKLCMGACSFRVTEVGARMSLKVTDLLPHTTYFYALAARDNVSLRCGPRSKTVKARTGDPIPDDGPGPHDETPVPVHRRPPCRSLG